MGSVWQVELDGDSLTLSKLVRLADPRSKIVLAERAIQAVVESRNVVDQMLEKRQTAYGINTGFGLFSNVIIDDDKLEKLQLNLIRSHSSGIGEPLTYERTRMVLAVRINVLCRGNSGVSLKTLEQMVSAFNAGCISVVPCQGTVGASGDLAPLAHLALGLIGEGFMWNPPENLPEQLSNETCNGQQLFSFESSCRTWEKKPAEQMLAKHGLQPIRLGAKEGLALINGTQMITALGCEAAFRARNVACCADVIAALTLEVLKGTVNAFHPRIHERRPYRGQGKVAARLRALLHPGQPSELFLSHMYHGRVQDPYSLRCIPQVHGIAQDTISFVQSILETELNSSGDNPMVFAESMDVVEEVDGEMVHVWPPKRMTRQRSSSKESLSSQGSESDPKDLESAKEEIKRLKARLAQKDHSINAAGYKRPSDTFYNNTSGSIISGGNFHAEYPAKALDYLAIGVCELASISERRLERLVNPSLSNLPAFLVQGGGLNSGFMIAHCAAASLVSENKVLAHPASVDSISTSGAKEDHVSMGGMSARKAIQVVENVERVLAIELLAAAQALEFHRPLATTEPLEAVVALVRKVAKPWDEDRVMNVDIDAVTEIIRSGKLWATVRPFLVDYSGTLVEEGEEDSFI